MKPIRISVVLALVIILGYQYYSVNYTDKGILDKVMKRQGYSLEQIESPVTVKLFIEPEWIPFESDKPKKVKVKLLETNGTNIILENVWNRENDIYFSFHPTFNMEYNGGRFMYNGILHEGGGITNSDPIDVFILYDKNGNKIDVGQTGSGPGSDFSFGVYPDNQELLQDGFYVEFSGFILYKYSRM